MPTEAQKTLRKRRIICIVRMMREGVWNADAFQIFCEKWGYGRPANDAAYIRSLEALAQEVVDGIVTLEGFGVSAEAAGAGGTSLC